MFWRVTQFTTMSPIEAVLDKEDRTLEELLSEEDIIQECKTGNQRLVQFLGNRSVIQQLINYLLVTPDDEAHFNSCITILVSLFEETALIDELVAGSGDRITASAHGALDGGYSYTACEIFCCEIDEVLTTLIKDEELMAQLFSLLDEKPPLKSTVAGYFGRVVGSILIKRPQDTHAYLERHQEILKKLVDHIDTTSTVEVILRMLGVDDFSGGPPVHAEWISKTDFMQQLADRLCAPPAPTTRQAALQRAAQQHVGNILVAIAQSSCSEMLYMTSCREQLTSHEYMQRMLDMAARENSSVLLPVLHVCIALLDPKIAPHPTMPFGSALLGPLDAPAEPDRAAVSQAVHEIVPHLDRFAALLAEGAVDSSTAAEQEQPYGTLKPPLGRRRLTVVEFGKALLGTGEAAAVRAMLNSAFVPNIMRLFKEYPFNNLLHNHVIEILQNLVDMLEADKQGVAGTHSDNNTAPDSSVRGASLPGAETSEMEAAPGNAPEEEVPDQDILDFLLDTCNIMEWIIRMPNLPPPSEGFKPRRHAREQPVYAAYIGHLTRLAHRLEKCEHGTLSSSLQMSKEWLDFNEKILQPRLETEDPNNWSMGTPEVLNDPFNNLPDQLDNVVYADIDDEADEDDDDDDNVVQPQDNAPGMDSDSDSNNSDDDGPVVHPHIRVPGLEDPYHLTNQEDEDQVETDYDSPGGEGADEVDDEDMMPLSQNESGTQRTGPTSHATHAHASDDAAEVDETVAVDATEVEESGDEPKRHTLLSEFEEQDDAPEEPLADSIDSTDDAVEEVAEGDDVSTSDMETHKYWKPPLPQLSDEDLPKPTSTAAA